MRSCSRMMLYKMLFDSFVGFAYLYTVLDMPRQIRIVCLHKVSVLCFVNNGLADKTSTEPGLCGPSKYQKLNRNFWFLRYMTSTLKLRSFCGVVKFSCIVHKTTTRCTSRHDTDTYRIVVIGISNRIRIPYLHCSMASKWS